MGKKDNRLFLGIKISPEAKVEISRFREYHNKLNGIRWVKEEQLHITIIFLGKVPCEMMENLIELIRVATREMEVFSMRHQGIYLGPNKAKARMIWLRWQKNPAFKSLSQQLHFLYKQVDPSHQQRKSPIPHTTIARLNEFNAPEMLNLNFQLTIPELVVEKVILWNSELTQEGPIYNEVKSFPLNIREDY